MPPIPKTNVVFFQLARGEVPLLQWLNDPKIHNAKSVKRFHERVDLLAMRGEALKRPYADYLRDGIRELRFHWGHKQYRVLYSFVGRKVVLLTHGITKEQKVPEQEIDRALLFREIYLENPVEHTYIG